MLVSLAAKRAARDKPSSPPPRGASPPLLRARDERAGSPLSAASLALACYLLRKRRRSTVPLAFHSCEVHCVTSREGLRRDFTLLRHADGSAQYRVSIASNGVFQARRSTSVQPFVQFRERGERQRH